MGNAQLIVFTIGVPNKGRLKGPSIDLLRKAGYDVPENGRCLNQRVGNLDIFYLRVSDIPVYISEGAVEAGITGLDRVLESGLCLKEILNLDFGQCKLVLAGPENKKLKAGVKIGTSFPNLTARWLAQKGVAAHLISVSGSVELLPRMNVADLIADLTSSGETLRENSLVVKDIIMESSARLFCKKKKPKCLELARRLEEVLRND